MRHALLADVHGNADALMPVLAEARSDGVEHLILLGDYLGYYYAAEQVVTELRRWPHLAILGNHDALLLASLDDDRSLEPYTEMYGQGLQVALATLSDASVAWLRALTPTATLRAGRFSVFLAHGTPHDPAGYLYPDATAEAFARCAIPGYDLVVLGHTHRPLTVVTSNGLLLNPGSVGQARDIGGYASWVLFDDATGNVSPRKTPYDPIPTLRRALLHDPSRPRLREALVRNNLTLAARWETEAATIAAGGGGR
jgi:putative phosphoesterase